MTWLDVALLLVIGRRLPLHMCDQPSHLKIHSSHHCTAVKSRVLAVHYLWTARYSAVQFSAVQCSAVYSAWQCRTTHGNEEQHMTIRHGTMVHETRYFQPKDRQDRMATILHYATHNGGGGAS
ncbi:unnamed protein product [Sphacelaria rigidula]